MYLGRQNYAMVNAGTNLPHNYISTSDPTITTNPPILNMTWLNSVTGEIFVCIDNTVNRNVWHGQLGNRIMNLASLSSVVAIYDFSDNSSMFVDDGVTNVATTDDTVYRVNDLSGNSNHLLQTDPTRRPLFKLSTITSSLPSVDFNGTSHCLDGGTTALNLDTSNLSIIAVYTPRSDYSYVLQKSIAAAAVGRYGYGVSDDSYVGLYENAASTHTTLTPETPDFNVLHIGAQLLNRSKGYVSVRSFGFERAITSFTAESEQYINSYTLGVGAYNSSSGDLVSPYYYSDIIIHQIVVLKSTEDLLADTILVENILTSKWAD